MLVHGLINYSIIIKESMASLCPMLSYCPDYQCDVVAVETQQTDRSQVTALHLAFSG